MTDTQQLIQKLAKLHGRERHHLLPILQGIEEEERYLSPEAMIEVAKTLDMSAAEVYGVASFFHFLETESKGKCKIYVCKSITCENKRKKDILEVLESLLKIKSGETTRDGRFSLSQTNCLGWCHKGPVMLVNNEVFTELTPKKTRKIVGDLIREGREELENIDY
jgi:NADH:ubiquinone oxidoreductase subunit E